ncbi:MAG TPA: hypothetical protein VID20_08685 [Sphingomicrobium sp.]|jgi:hypothetical protein
MIVRHCLAALLVGCATAPAGAQDAQNLLAKNLEARGGAAALDAIKNVSFEGRTIFPGDFEVTYKETHARLGPSGAAGRVDFGIQGLEITQAYDGNEGWRVNPLQGRKDAEKMSADEGRALADAVLVEGPLLAAKTDGSRVDYLGREDFDGTNAYKLKVTQKDGDEFTYWLDPDTFLEIKVDETRKIRGAEQTTETELGDYEKIAGVYFPMSVESWAQGQPAQRQRTIIASGSANTQLASDYFAEPFTPAPTAKAAAQPGVGNTKKGSEPRAKPAATKKPPVNPSHPAKGE